MKYDASEMFFCEERTCVVVRSKTVTKILSFTQVFPFFFMQDPFSKTTLYVMKVKQGFQEIAVCLVFLNVHKPWLGLKLYWPDQLISSAPFSLPAFYKQINK